MKNLILIFTIIIFSNSFAFAQKCNIKIEILPEQYMQGTAKTVSEATAKNGKIQVNFTEDIMEISMPMNGQNYLIEIQNDNCQAYCKKQKRVRQLHSGDEKLVINLIKERQEDLVAQLKSCS